MSQNNSAKHQYADQTTKGGVLALISYSLMKQGFDDEFVAIVIPFVAMFLSWTSTKVGDKKIASFFGINGKNDGKPIKVNPSKKSASMKSAKRK